MHLKTILLFGSGIYVLGSCSHTPSRCSPFPCMIPCLTLLLLSNLQDWDRVTRLTAVTTQTVQNMDLRAHPAGMVKLDCLLSSPSRCPNPFPQGVWTPPSTLGKERASPGHSKCSLGHSIGGEGSSSCLNSWDKSREAASQRQHVWFSYPERLPTRRSTSGCTQAPSTSANGGTALETKMKHRGF